MTKRRTWILVADAGQARFFMSEGAGADPLPIEEARFDNPAAHGHSRDLVTDKPGRSIESVGGAHHAQEPRLDPHRAAKASFAKRIAEYIEQCAVGEKFDGLVLVAPSQMLGDLRGALGKHAARRLVGTTAKDLMKIPSAELKTHLRPILEAVRRPQASG